MAITDLTGTTWRFRDVLPSSNSYNGYVEFICNDREFTRMEILNQYFLVYHYNNPSPGSESVYNYMGGGWFAQVWRTVTITGGRDVTNPDFIAVLSKAADLIREECVVTYRISNGKWEDGTTANKTETVLEGDLPVDIPENMIPDSGYTIGSWSPDPYTTPVRSNMAFDYIFRKPYYEILYKVVNGKWANGTTAPIKERVDVGGTPRNIPTGMTPIAGYTGGAWDINPEGVVINDDVTFSYKFTAVSPTPGIPRMASVIPYYRLRLGNQVSEWIKKGEFFIDTRSVSNNGDGIDVFDAQCFDSMLKTNANYGYSSLTWPALDTDVISEVCRNLGFIQDERNASVMIRNYMIPSKPVGMTYRDVLSYIGVMYAANWIFTDDGKLRIVPIADSGDTLDVGRSVQNITDSPLRSGYTKVSIYVSESQTIESGTSDDNVMEAQCPWATQEIADYVYSVLSSWQYKPCTASGVWGDPAVEVFDTLETDTTSFTVFSRDLEFGSVVGMDLSAPNDNYIEHEYAYNSPSIRNNRNAIGNIEKEVGEQKEKIDIVVTDQGINGPAIIDAINYAGSASKINADKINLAGIVFEELHLEDSTGSADVNPAGIVFKDLNDDITGEYPATGLSISNLNGNESELEATSGSTKTYTLGAGVYLISTAKMDDTSADEDSLYMASVGETGMSHISEILAPTGTTAVALSGDTLSVTTGDANVQIVINKIG